MADWPVSAIALVSTTGPADGAIEIGKDGDLVLFDGDPFEYTTLVTAVVIEGEVVSETAR
ncbi:MAG: hypothetical protein CVV17_13215 [Gammaproteobacteria bacterium HGW-Gammaproteobacteria-7]|nr:MAG: hypothetical protein CVV17_13215 [Gammaproteobacteria bacterium HGW-Gammaproteobacteria-7]